MWEILGYLYIDGNEWFSLEKKLMIWEKVKKVREDGIKLINGKESLLSVSRG